MEVRAMEVPTTMEVNNGSLSGYNSSDIFLWRKISAFCYLLCIQYIFMNGLINGAFFLNMIVCHAQNDKRY